MSGTSLTQCTVYGGIPNVTLQTFGILLFFFFARGLRESRHAHQRSSSEPFGTRVPPTRPPLSDSSSPPAGGRRGHGLDTWHLSLGEQTSCSQPVGPQVESSGKPAGTPPPPTSHRRLGWPKHCHKINIGFTQARTDGYPLMHISYFQVEYSENRVSCKIQDNDSGLIVTSHMRAARG